ncbi:hypothetical protein AUK40_04760 [Candidatus Wirthbacteria bacterium CG2_30_54_11]|uniref:Zinc finger DksA/TraR C4-type domain-containing protein n=1 Tax=Candidatus Wirthbacteria bacterium CG2_30_54_11 TaxID=1817892 RepID=A0A1J5IZH4_9BACT|nr:MAG: hypothetical protein AUK40_04760 [Candidatus Wirthbacteria bacterium CG2_30_54_11]
MTTALESFRSRLEKHRDALSALMSKTTDEQKVTEEGFVPPSTHGQDDEAERVVGLEMGIMTQENLKHAHLEIIEALSRIEDGSYGICVDCGERIAEKRLSFAPASRYCISCQIKHEGM